MNIWLAYVNYPITTAVYLRRALLQAGHCVTTIGPRLPEEAIELWGLQNMHLPLEPLDIDTSFAPDMAALWNAIPSHEQPDLYLWVESVNGYRPQNLDVITCPKACWLIDTHYHLPEALETAVSFDYVFIAQLVDLASFRAQKAKTYWLPLACDPEIHGQQEVTKCYDIGFVGSINNRRTEMLDYLAEHFNVQRERSFWTDMARTFSASKIVLNDASFDDLNMRYFEAMASGSLLLANMAKGSGQDTLFIAGRDYACHHDDDLLEVASRYLADDALREKVALEGKKRVLAAHTYQHRVDDLLGVVTGRREDTPSPTELRSRSLTPNNSEQQHAVTPRIRSIVTTRYRSNWPTWQMVHEWEDILATMLTTPFRPIDESCQRPDPDCLTDNFDLIFLQLASELRYYATNPQLIPIVMDLWRDDFDEFRQFAPYFSLIFVTNPQAYQELQPNIPNLHYLPFSLADQYFNRQLPKKDIDLIQYGRRNPLLDQFVKQFLNDHPEIQYITTEASTEELDVRIYSNKSGFLGESDSRSTFMGLLDRCKISLVSTVGMDGSRSTGGIDPVSPRFLESMAAGCHLVGRIPSNDEFKITGIAEVCHQVNSYREFDQTVCTLLRQCEAPVSKYHGLLQKRLTSALPARIISTLRTLNHSIPKSPTPEELMQNAKPAHDLICRLNEVRQLANKAPNAVIFNNYHTLCDVIASYREFHNLDLSYLYTEMFKELLTNDMVLLISALELVNKGEIRAALTVARRVMALSPTNPQAAFLSAELLRRCSLRTEARLACIEMLKKWPDFGEAKAVQDMCDVDDALPIEQEHYHLLHSAHCLLRPRRYVEIGISNGKSLSLVQQGSSAVGVDPITGTSDHLFFHSPDVTPNLYKLTSNDFFQQGGMEQVWGTQPFDMAFIDGLHLFEQALLDFIHLEQRSASDSIIFIHDCLPVSINGAERTRSTMVWTGDVWKVILCLKQVRPDLEITTFPVRPSGLAMIRRPDRTSRVLTTQFDTLVSHFIGARLPEEMTERFHLLNVTETPYKTVLSDIAQQQGSWQDRTDTVC